MKRLILKNRIAQSTIEYCIILGVVLTAVIASGMLDKISKAFNTYFNNATEYMLASSTDGSQDQQ